MGKQNQNSNNITAPVLFVIFNRPETTQVVFNEIRKAKPGKLYVAADGPRPGNEEDKLNCRLARDIVKQVDWDCELKTRFLDKNLGCGYGVSSAISWVFENEETAIILEDDCKPSPAFFPFCQELLEKYKNDEKVCLISGNNYNEEFTLQEDYIFSEIAHHIWGWATWKRAWDKFDISKKYYQKMIRIKPVKELYETSRQGKFFERRFTRGYSKDVITHAWGMQWAFVIRVNEGLTIVPRKNLVANIGLFGVHSGGLHDYHNRPSDKNFHISKHPGHVIINKAYDNYHFKNHWKKMVKSHSLTARIIRKLKKMIAAGN